MAFVAEDGTGLDDANSLCDVAYADAYFVDRANTVWAALTTANKQVALIKATDYIETRYLNRWKGSEQFPDNPQALSFPRLYIGYDDQVPINIKKATAEYALRSRTAPLGADPTVDASGLQVQSTRNKVGPIETEKTFKEGGSISLWRPYPMADGLLKGFLKPTGGLVRN